jgi:hypothetical protein
MNIKFCVKLKKMATETDNAVCLICMSLDGFKEAEIDERTI